ncbi:hypothetical protein HYDPIDRAFT_106805 [Hydnomerulius pinastri MD-312]|nr:hypothetical protein HYDPIDRAFT_106805 [Hydnomerulius pinastri MD-312]
MPTPTSGKRESFKRSQDFKHSATGPGWVCTICPATHKGQLQFPNFKAALNHERNSHELSRDAAEHNRGTTEAAPEPTARGRTSEHNWWSTDDTGWDKIEHPPLTSEGLRTWEMQAHVDHVSDLVPFWRRAVEAAERGEVLRLEEFLEKMEGDGGWRTADDVLGMLGKSKEIHGWAASQRGWGDWAAITPSERARDYRGPDWGGPDLQNWAASNRGGWGVASTRIASDATQSSGQESGWGAVEGWAVAQESRRRQSKSTLPFQGRVPSAHLPPQRVYNADPYQFVDSVARQRPVSEERRKQMHRFFEVCLLPRVLPR